MTVPPAGAGGESRPGEGAEVADALDHVGVAGPDLAALASAWERLGFTLTPVARHSGRRTPDGPIEPFGTANRCAMLRQGYLELIAITDRAAFSNGLDRLLARHAGIHILALSIADEAANLARLRRAGLDIPGIAYLERPVDDAEPTGPRARFARLPLPDAPEGRIQLIRHLTPDAIWQERFLSHPNQAEALEEVILAVEAPAETAARLSRLAGRPVVPDEAGGLRLELRRGCVRMLPPESLGDVLPGVAIPSLPFIAGLRLRTADGAAALRRLVPTREVPGGAGWMVPPEEAGGAALVFT